MAFKSDFIKIFQDGLEPYGFKRMKGTSCFGKLISNEILIFIMYKKCSSPDRGKRVFDIISGVQTVYSYELSEHQLELSGTSIINYSPNVQRTALNVNFIYDESNQLSVINQALQQTISDAIPILLQINDLQSSLDFLIKYKLGMLYPVDTFFRDSVLLILTNNHDSFEERIRQEEEIALRLYSDEPDEVFKSYMRQITDIIKNKLVKSRDRVWASRELQEELQKEIERRIKNNKNLLTQYGLLIE